MRRFLNRAAAAALMAGCSTEALASTNWTASGLPVTGSVTIASDQSIILDTDLSLTDLTIEGELICGDRNLSLAAKWIMVHDGRFQCGTEDVPYQKNLTITLEGSNQSEDNMGMGTKFLGAMAGGEIELHGENRLGWTRLAATARRGATTITLKSAPPWRVGDRIVIVSTDYHPDHGEERTVTAVKGATVTFDMPLQYQHWCATFASGGKSISECGEVGLLTRNILIKGDETAVQSGFGGHVMVMASASARISGVEFLHMGQKGKLARYPMHWHLVGDATGQYLDNCAIDHSYNRFLSIHGTHNLHVGGNVGYDTIGHGYYMEDGIEHGNTIEDNLGAMVRNATDQLPTPSDAQASVFWISNPDNIVRRNVAAGSEDTGFWLGFPEHPIGLSTAAGVDVWPRRTPLKVFSRNVSHSNDNRGLFIDGAEDATRHTQVTWYEPRQTPADENSPVVPPVFDRFTAYKNRAEGSWLRSFSKPVMQAPRFADNWMGAYFASLSGKPGFIQDGLVVGETGNKGNPASWEKKGLDGRELPQYWSPHVSIRGLEYYDGPMVVRRTRFANFKSNSQRKSGALTNLSPNPFWISSLSGAQALSFDNANRVWLDPLIPNNDGDAFSAIRDADGSLTGLSGRRVVPANPLMVTPSCIAKPASNAYVCPHNYVGVEVVTNPAEDLSGAVITRNDGARHKLASAPSYPGTLHMNLLENRPHALSLPAATPKSITFVRYEQAGKAVRLSLSYPAGAFTVTLWGYPIPKASSLGALATGSSKYFYDSTAKRLHLRLVSDDGDWKEYVVARP
jgi:hypothetical protein